MKRLGLENMMMLTEDDFSIQYANLDDSYPKIALWSTTSPINMRTMQFSATILQRKENESSEWSFIPSIKPSDPNISNSDSYGTDRFTDESDITLKPERDMISAVKAITKKIASLCEEYS